MRRYCSSPAHRPGPCEGDFLSVVSDQITLLMESGKFPTDRFRINIEWRFANGVRVEILCPLRERLKILTVVVGT